MKIAKEAVTKGVEVTAEDQVTEVVVGQVGVVIVQDMGEEAVRMVGTLVQEKAKRAVITITEGMVHKEL